MGKTIFYSWQSDLPNNKNRGFISQCIEKSISQINDESLSLELVIDRDTKGVTGTPDIASTVFNKIDNAAIFVADISFINSDSKFRKCPNPNVLVELGYAAKTLGWNNIICIFNSEFGNVEDLPFDLRFRRPLIYKIDESDKPGTRKKLISMIKSDIVEIISQRNDRDELNAYIKQQIDKEIIGICSHLFKLIIGFEDYTMEKIQFLLSLNIEDLQYHMFEKKFVGFTVVKDWQSYIKDLEQIMNQPFFVQHSTLDFNRGIIDVIRCVTTLAVLQKQNNNFIDSGQKVKGFTMLHGRKLNPDNPKDKYALLKDEDETKGIVVDSGVIMEYNVRKATNFMTISNDFFPNYISTIYSLIQAINNYLDKSGREFILDPIHFKIKNSQQ